MSSSDEDKDDEAEDRAWRKSDTERRLRAKQRRRLRSFAWRAKYRAMAAALPARAARVHLDGLHRTDAGLVAGLLAPVLAADRYADLLSAVRAAQADMKLLGCFKAVDVLLDVEDFADRDACDVSVTFTMQELPRFRVGAQPTLSASGDLQVRAVTELPNLAGNGASLRLGVARGLWSTSSAADTLSLVRTWFLRGACHLTLMAEAAWMRAELPRRELREEDRAVRVFGVLQPCNWLQSRLTAELSHRRLETMTSSSSFAAREECGHSLKASVSHSLTVDTRDDRVLPRRGVLLRWTEELAAGPKGYVACARRSLLASVHVPIGEGKTSLSISAALGRVAGDAFNSADLFRFCSPLACRAVLPAGRLPLGPVQHLAAASAKLTFPVPLLRGGRHHWLLSRARSHVFCDAGAVSMGGMTSSSVCAGLGLTVRLGGDVGRAELNLCCPLTRGGGNAGLQFGVAVDFL